MNKKMLKCCKKMRIKKGHKNMVAHIESNKYIFSFPFGLEAFLEIKKKYKKISTCSKKAINQITVKTICCCP
jgi:hypothetical protein